VNNSIFYSWTVAEFTFDGGSSTSPGNTPMFSSASSLDGRYTVQVSNYDSAFTYSVTSTVGQATISSTGLVTVTGLSKDQAVSVTVTTTRTGYTTASASITGRSQVLPMLPTNKPTVTISDTLITCTIGSYSATPTSAAFSLFVDGKHISTNFSALGEYLPDWIIPWATSSSITRTASLTSATWAMSDAYKGKSITCTTLAYSNNATGLTSSQKMMVK
jgi:titin